MLKMLLSGAAALTLATGAAAAPATTPAPKIGKSDHCRPAKGTKPAPCAAKNARAAGTVVKSKSNITNNRTAGH